MTQVDNEEVEVYKVCFYYLWYGKELHLESVIQTGYEIEYPIGEWREAPSYGPMLAFDTLENAIEFLHRFSGSSQERKVIYRAVATGVKKQHVLLQLTYISWGDLEDFWSSGTSRATMLPDDYRLMPAPHGTVACERIKLLERVNITEME